MASAGPEAAEGSAPSLVDFLQQLELPALDRLMDELAWPWLSYRHQSVAHLRLTCRALRDLTDASVRIGPRRLALQLREDGIVTEPLAALGRWGRRGGITLKLELQAEAPDGVDVLLPVAFAELPEQARRRVREVYVGPSNYSAPSPVVSGAAVGALAASLPCLRRLNVMNLLPTWTPGGTGEAYTALAALGTLEELELPGVPGVTGVDALAGSLRSLTLREHRGPHHALTVSAAAPLGQLTRLKTLGLYLSDIDLGKGPTLQNLLRLLPPSLRVLTLDNRKWSGSLLRGLDGIFGVSDGRLVSAQLGWEWRPQELAVLARGELLPCLGPDGRLESLSVGRVLADGWGSTDVVPLLELWRHSDRAHVQTLAVEKQDSGADVCNALAAVGPVESLCLDGDLPIKLALPEQTPLAPPAHAPLLDLPLPEEVLRMALQRIAPPGAGGEGGAAGGRPGSAVDEAEDDGQLLLVRGPAAATALARPRARALTAWAQDLEQRARAVLGPALKLRGPLIEEVLLLPPASAVLLGCSKAVSAAEVVVAAVAAASDGSEAVRVTIPPSADSVESALVWGLGKVMSELWAASCAGEGGPSLEQRVEWAMAVRVFVNDLPGYEAV